MNMKDLAGLANSPWSLLLAVVGVLVLWEGGKKWLPALVEWLARRLGQALAGTALIRRRALQTYRQRVAARYAKLPVLFMPDKGLDASKVYVSLQTMEVGGDQLGDAYEAIKATHHVVVLGHPGAGKTMLLRHSMLMWARNPAWRRTQRVPVLFELHRCAGSPRTLEEHVIAQFDEDGFPKADGFVHRALREGRLSLLFDGFDEVSVADRARVVQLVRGFAVRYPACQIVVTCRTAIYHQQLAPEITTLFRVAEFDDRHIHRFLMQWPLTTDETAARWLFAVLVDTPRIMQLARNPLLLTIIAYLYGGRPRNQLVLPHSRAEFYHEAIDILLDRLKDSRNLFKGPVKKAVLLRLASAMQRPTGKHVDRRTLYYEYVLAEIMALASRLNLRPGDADALLDEIVDRSGLLLRVDGGARFQFAHLSLQEYLVAVAHERDGDGMLARYREAPDDWREVVKLWCGAVSVDCGPLIEKVYLADEVLAFECLADAQVVDEAVARRIIAHFQRRLLRDDQVDPAVIAAFGVVAADPRPRGQQVLRFLTERALARHSNAFAALAATKLASAASVLVSRLVHPAARFALLSMGDLAVPALADAAAGGRADTRVQAIEMLGEIGTPAAVAVLVRLLWKGDDNSYQAAWRLAALLPRPEVEAVLATLDPPQDTPTHAWVWEPFRDRDRPSVARIAARIALLCESCPRSELPATPLRIDPRLAIPLIALGFNGRVRPQRPWIAHRLARLRGHHRRSELAGVLYRDAEADAAIVRTVIGFLQPHVSATELALCEAIDVRLSSRLLTRLVERGETVRRQDWTQIHGTEADFEFRRSWLFRVPMVLVLLYLAAVGLGAAQLISDEGVSVSSWLHPMIVASLGGAVLTVTRLLMGPTTVFPRPVFRGLLLTYLAAVAVLATLVGVHYFGWLASVGLNAVVITTCVAMIRRGVERKRAAQNPLRGLLEIENASAPLRTSIIAP